MFARRRRAPEENRYPPRTTEWGSLPGLSKGLNLTPAQQAVEAAFAAKAHYWDLFKQAYWALAKGKYGTRRVIDADLARLLAGPGVYDTPEQRLDNLAPTNGVATEVTINCFHSLLHEPPRRTTEGVQDRVLFLMGVGCSGKSTAARLMLDKAGDWYHAIFMRVASKRHQLRGNIDKILECGKTVDLQLVLRKPEDLFTGIIKRAMETGQVEPLGQVAVRYGECLAAFESALDYYEKNPDPGVKIGIVTNFGDKPEGIHFSDENPRDILARIKNSIPGYHPSLGEAGLKKALVHLAYEMLECHDWSNCMRPSEHRLTGRLRTAVIGNKEKYLADAKLPDHDTIYAGMTHDVAAEGSRLASAIRPPRVRAFLSAALRHRRNGD